MSNLLVGTNYVFEDDLCLKLFEQDIMATDNSGFHRYLVFDVLRGGEKVEFREDCGSVEKFRGIEPVVLWTGIVDGGVFYGHRVGEAREMLDQYRNHVHFDNKDLVGVDNLILR